MLKVARLGLQVARMTSQQGIRACFKAVTLQRRVEALRAGGWAITDSDPQWPAEAREYPLLAL